MGELGVAYRRFVDFVGYKKGSTSFARRFLWVESGVSPEAFDAQSLNGSFEAQIFWWDFRVDLLI